MALKLTIEIKPLVQMKTVILDERQSFLLGSSRLHSIVKRILHKVRTYGDRALFQYSQSFDSVDLSKIGVTIKTQDIQNAYQHVSHTQIQAITYLRDRIHDIEEARLKRSSYPLHQKNLRITNVCKPIQSVGCYVPGGQASYPSSLLMTVVPAKTAGVPRIIVCSPPSYHQEINPFTLVAADLCGVDEIYRVGGAQAIAAMAYGTPSIPPVLKIVGPGNRYVTLAKALVATDIAVDYPYGPSELLILADETAEPKKIVLDLISQAEHTPDNIVGLITPSRKLAIHVLENLHERVKTIERQHTVIQSINQYGFILVSETMSEAIDFVNAFAPEHLEIMTKDASHLTQKIMSAGVILIGPYTPAAASDYCFGTNHVLPTNGYSRMYSGLSVLDFVKRVTVIESSQSYLQQIMNIARIFAECEDLPNHFQAIQGRLLE